MWMKIGHGCKSIWLSRRAAQRSDRLDGNADRPVGKRRDATDIAAQACY
jgi:hypothetical protein